MFESQIYSMRKIRDFIDILNGFEIILNIIKMFDTIELQSSLLIRIIKSKSKKGNFPIAEIQNKLNYFREIFDEKQAKRDGMIRPKPSMNLEYDEAKADVANIEKEFEIYLKEQKNQTGITDLKYFGSNKDRFQLEVPMGQTGKVPHYWTTKTQKKTHRRYWTPFIEKKLALLVEAENRLVYKYDTILE